MSTNTTIELGGHEYRIERVSARKASTALALLRALSRSMPELQRDLATFRRDYEANNVIELDRVQAKLRYPPRPLTELTEDGVERAVLEADGTPRLLPSPVDRLTEADWERSGQTFKVPASPSTPEVITALFDKALDVAEEHVYRLLALFTLSNDDVARYRKDGSLKDQLADRSDSLLDDAFADEVLELAVVAGEVVDEQFRRKTDELGDRLGNALSLVGLRPPTRTTPTPAPSPPAPSKDGPSSLTPSSSTDSPAPTPDGPPTPSSTSPSTSSSSSAPSSSETTTPSANRNGATAPPPVEATA